MSKLVPLIPAGGNGAAVLVAAGYKRAKFNLQRLSWERPAFTVTKYFGWRAAGIHPVEDRLPTGRELCRLQSFPDEYRWGGSTYAQIQDRLGNSVPPLMMRAVALAVRHALDGSSHDRRPDPVTGGYGAELSSAWADHLAPRKPDAPTVVSLFAGCGGSSLGYSMAGYRELLAVEWDDHAAAMFRLNFPDVPLHHGDVADVDPATLGLAPGELDVLDGSPPCQGFSTAGSRSSTDPRNDLFRQYVRLLDAWQPRAFVMENVSGLVKGKMKLKFVEMLAALKAAGPGYRVSVRLLDASRFRVPQARQRLIFIGVRSDLDTNPAHPHPIAGALTVRDAWVSQTTDLPAGPPLKPTYKVAILVPLIQPGRNGGDALTAGGRKGSAFSLARLAYDRPSPTITKHRAAWNSGLIHPACDELATGRELCRLQSFPDEYMWGDSLYAQIQDRLGNSVPPLMMRAIATAVRDTLDSIDKTRIQPL